MEKDGKDNTRQNRDKREQGPGAIAQKTFKEEGDHDSFPRKASVGLRSAIFLVGK